MTYEAIAPLLMGFVVVVGVMAAAPLTRPRYSAKPKPLTGLGPSGEYRSRKEAE